MSCKEPRLLWKKNSPIFQNTAWGWIGIGFSWLAFKTGCSKLTNSIKKMWLFFVPKAHYPSPKGGRARDRWRAGSVFHQPVAIEYNRRNTKRIGDGALIDIKFFIRHGIVFVFTGEDHFVTLDPHVA